MAYCGCVNIQACLLHAFPIAQRNGHLNPSCVVTMRRYILILLDIRFKHSRHHGMAKGLRCNECLLNLGERYLGAVKCGCDGVDDGLSTA